MTSCSSSTHPCASWAPAGWRAQARSSTCRYRESGATVSRTRDRLNKLFAVATGQPLSKIEEDTHRNFWLDAEAAVKYGLVGKMISGAKELDGK
jgi:ATP-dependent protease ClpP protease subunit